MKKTLIVGAGISGLVAAHCLRSANIDVKLVERQEAPKRDGFYLQITGGALQTLRSLGLSAALARGSIPVERATMMTSRGGLIRTDDIADFVHIDRGGVFLRRSDLVGSLLEIVNPLLRIDWGTTVTALDPNTGECRFSNGESDRFDFIIGADGVNSAVRSILFGDSGVVKKDIAFCSFLVANDVGLSIGSYRLAGVGRQISITALNGSELYGLCWFRAKADLPRRGPALAARLADEFKTFGWVVPQVLAGLDRSDTLFGDMLTQVSLAAWHRGRAVLVGDAAHCLSPASARGAALAVLGGADLGNRLGKAPSPDAYIRYEQAMMEGVERHRAMALRNAELFLPTSQLGLASGNLLMRLMPKAVMKNIMRKHFSDDFVIT